MDKLMGALFDWSMRKPATPQLVRILYILAVILAGLQGVGLILGGFAKGVVSGVIGLLLAPIVFFVTVAVARVGLEAILAIHRTASYTGELARAQRPRHTDPGFDAPPPAPAAGGANTTRVSMMGKSGF